MPDTAQRRVSEVTLTGDWRFTTDPEDRGLTEGWYERDASWDDERTVSVPDSWQEHDDLRDYTGAAWYRTTFQFDGVADGERALITFGAVDYETTVWVNGERVGENAGGYLPFTVDATDAISAGDNTVTLRVFDPQDMSEIPHGKQGDPWYTRVSGPWQDVDLVTVPETRVDDVRVTPDLEEDVATFDVSTNATDDLRAAVTVSRDGDVVARRSSDLEDGSATVPVEVPDAEYWTPENPALYDFGVALLDGDVVVDNYEDYFGMRSVSYEDGDLYLNGEPFTMRGALDQAFYPETYYRPRDIETFETEIRAAKELGFNLLRKHIKPAHPEFVELADRIGMLVWEEPANPKRYTETSKAGLREQLKGMIDRDYNSPSVIAWSIYNEEWGIGYHDDEEPLWTDEEKQDYLEELYYETLEWDETRLVCDNSGWAHVATDLNDYHEYFVAPDRLDAWRDRLDEMIENPAGNYGDVRTDPEDAPLLVSEFGTWGLSDVTSLTDHYDGDPHWFGHDFLESMKRPSGVQRRFAESHVSSVFDSLDDLAAAWQTREFESVEPIIADMREREGVAGYVITELTDIEWEFNGILDYLREEKSFYDDFARLNAPVMLHLDLDAHAAWSGEELTADLVVVNDTNDPVETTVDWEALSRADSVDVSVEANGSRRIEDAVAVDSPTVDELDTYEVTATMADPEWTVSRSVYVAPEANGDIGTSIFAESNELSSALAERGYDVTDDATTADLAVATDPDDHDAERTLVVPDADGDLTETSEFEYTDLPKRESWNLCACFVYQDLLSSVDAVPGWAFEDIYPYGYVADPSDEDDVSVGYTEGWLENSGAIALTRGTTGVCTLRVTDTYGDHPIATATLDQLIRDLA